MDMVSKLETQETPKINLANDSIKGILATPPQSYPPQE